jgi:hypothetical protein
MRVNLTQEGFCPAGGNFQSIRIYRSDVVSFLGGELQAAHDLIVRDESARLSLGMVASPQSLLPFHPT